MIFHDIYICLWNTIPYGTIKRNNIWIYRFVNYIEKKIERNIDIPEISDIIAIIGPRRVGKTFLILNKAKEFLNIEKQVIYVSFDEPLLLDIDVRKFSELIRAEYSTLIIWEILF